MQNNGMFKAFLIISALTAAMSLNSSAATDPVGSQKPAKANPSPNKKGKKVVQAPMPLPPLPSYQLSSEVIANSNYKEFVSNRMNQYQKNRSISNEKTDTCEETGILSASSIMIRNRFFAADTPEKLDALVKDIDNKEFYEKLDRDGRFLALQFLALKPYKSFIYRAQGYLGEHSALRSMIITGLRLTAAGQQIYADSPEQKALYDYYTAPISGMRPAIASDRDLESFMALEIQSSLIDIYNRYLKIVNDSTNSIHWDNKVYLSSSNFSECQDRYVEIGLPEQYLILAGLEGTISNMLITNSYELDGLNAAVKEIAEKFGVDVFPNPFTKVHGLSSYDRFQVLKAHGNLFHRKNNTKAYTEAAYGFLKSSVGNSKYAWERLDKDKEAKSQVSLWLNPQTLLPFSRVINTSFANSDKLFSDDSLSSAVLNGEKIKINFKHLYSEPPEYLSKMYPKDWDRKSETNSRKVDGKDVSYRNYMFGSASVWDYEVFHEYLPEIKPLARDPKLTDVRRELRILSQVWGMNIMGMSLGFLIF